MNTDIKDDYKFRTPDGKGIIFINAYAVSQNYGGPEEGGWWWDSGRALASVPVIDGDDAVIDFEKKRLTEMIGWVSRHKRTSVLGDEDFEIYVEDEPAKDWPERRPHYE